LHDRYVDSEQDDPDERARADPPEDHGRLAELQRLREEAERRARQQAALARLGLSALTEVDLGKVFDAATRTVVETLGVELTKILELLSDGRALLLRSGVGWHEGLVGSATLPSDVGSQAGYTLKSSAPVVVDDLPRETRFRGAKLLLDHGVRSGLSVIVHGRQGPWGVFGVHSRERRTFTPDDVNFVQSVANVIGAAIERGRIAGELSRREQELALRRAEERFRRAERLASVGTLATGIAHEINNPVNSILMTAEAAQMARGREDWPERADRALEIVVREAERCGRIVRDVLDLARPGSPGQAREDLGDVVRRAVDVARNLTKKGGLQVDLELADDLPPVALDAAAVERLVVHLMRNSIEASAAGKARVRVATERAGDDRVRLTVSDRGRGIEPALLGRIFDPFFSTRRTSGGVGLGLSLVHGIVEEHGGAIDVESRPGEGSTFRVELPLAGRPHGAGSAPARISGEASEGAPAERAG